MKQINKIENGTDQWAEWVRVGLSHYHDIEQLGQLAWGGEDSHFVVGCVVAEHIAQTEQRGYAIQAVLHWGLKQLKVSSSIYKRQSYETLRLRYVERLTVGACAKQLKRDITTIKQRQRKGWERLGKVLQAEWNTPVAQTTRCLLMWQLRYEACTLHEQRLLCFLAVFRQPIRMRVALVVDAVVFQPHLARLLARQLVAQDDQMQIIVPLQVQAVLLRYLSLT